MPTMLTTLADVTSRFVSLLVACAVLGFAGAAKAEQIVQVPLDQTFLNGRTVTTLTAGALVPWTKGVDGGGTFSGYMTKAASTFHGDPEDLAALPDDGVFVGAEPLDTTLVVVLNLGRVVLAQDFGWTDVGVVARCEVGRALFVRDVSDVAALRVQRP